MIQVIVANVGSQVFRNCQEKTWRFNPPLEVHGLQWATAVTRYNRPPSIPLESRQDLVKFTTVLELQQGPGKTLTLQRTSSKEGENHQGALCAGLDALGYDPQILPT